jgi:HEPN domain-containing protein
VGRCLPVRFGNRQGAAGVPPLPLRTLHVPAVPGKASESPPDETHRRGPAKDSHSLARLAELAGRELSQDDKAILERLSLYYLQSRYPPEIQALAKKITRSVAMTYMAQTEALWKRLRRHLIRNK